MTVIADPSCCAVMTGMLLLGGRRDPPQLSTRSRPRPPRRMAGAPGAHGRVLALGCRGHPRSRPGRRVAHLPARADAGPLIGTEWLVVTIREGPRLPLPGAVLVPVSCSQRETGALPELPGCNYPPPPICSWQREPPRCAGCGYFTFGMRSVPRPSRSRGDQRADVPPGAKAGGYFADNDVGSNPRALRRYGLRFGHPRSPS